jgi:diguanylate cyclase (GGDEF)-like protein
LTAEFPDDRGDGYLRPVLRAAEIAMLSDLVRNPVPFVFTVDDAAPPVRGLMQADMLETCAVAPIRARGEFLGLIAAGFATVADTFDTDELLTRLRGLADQAATALDNARLLDAMRDQALHDSLTGLANRTLVEDRAGQALREGQRYGRPMSLLFVDLDGFKPVNDRLGHEMGDELIRQAGERIARYVRGADTPARFGGDEFVIVLPNTDGDAAAVVADKLVAAMGEPFPLAGREVTLSCSIGIASAPEHGTDYGALLRHADAAMYAAKAAGGATFART